MMKLQINSSSYIQRTGKKIINRYEAHERLTKPGKSHPMPVPPSYLLNKFRKYRELYKNGEDLELLLASLVKPKKAIQ